MIPRYNKFTDVRIRDSGGSRGGARPSLFFDQNEARRAEKNFFGHGVPLSEGLDPPLRVPSKSPIHVESESSIDEDNIFPISPPIVKVTKWNLHDLTSHRQGVFDKKRKNWTLALLGKNWRTPTSKI